MLLFSILLIVQFCGGTVLERETKGVRLEIRPWQKFKVNCTEDEKITILSAFYGLMYNEDCLDGNETLNPHNCSTDVFDYVTSRCSENRPNYCEIDLPDDTLDRLSVDNCPKSALQYLEIVYDCQKSPNCPTYLPPVGSNVENTNDGYLVFCNDSRSTEWNVRCVRGNWTPYLDNECKEREGESVGLRHWFFEYAFPTLLAIICVSSVLLLCVVLKRFISNHRQRQIQPTDTYTFPARHLHVRREYTSVILEDTSAMESQSDERVHLYDTPIDVLDNSTQQYSVIMSSEYSGSQSLDNVVSSSDTCGNDDLYSYATIQSLF